MFEPESRDTPQRAGSLLSLGDSPRERVGEGSHLDTPRRGDDAAARHRLARGRREAQPNALLKALAQSGKPDHEHGPLPSQEPATPGVVGKLLALWSRPASQRRHEDAGLDRPLSASFDAPTRSSALENERDPLPHAGNGGDARLREADDRWKPLIDPMKLIGGVMRSKALIGSTAILGALLGVAIAISTPKKYEAVTELLIDPRDLKIVDRELTGGGLTNEATLAIVENQVRVLTSGSVLNQVVEKLNLENDPEFNGESAAGLGSIVSSLRALLSRQDAGAGGDNRRALAVGNLAESLSVERGGKTFVVMVSVVTQEPEKSALIANTMTEVFLQTYGKLQSDTAGRAAEELTARLDQLRKGVEEAERKVESFKAENDIIDAQGRLITDDEILKLNEQLSIARAKTLEFNAKAASTRQLDVDAVVGGTLPEEAASNVLVELRSQYASLKQLSDRMSVKLGPRHPESQAIAAELKGAREQILVELRRIVGAVQVELTRAVQLEQQLASRLAQLKVRQGDLSNELVTLRELERDATAKRAVYEAFLLRARETGEQKDLNTANMSVISTAYPPLEALGPSRSMISIAGLLLGFMAGVGIGLVRGALDSLRDGSEARGRSDPFSPSGGGGDTSARRSDPRSASQTSPHRSAAAEAPSIGEAGPALGKLKSILGAGMRGAADGLQVSGASVERQAETDIGAGRSAAVPLSHSLAGTELGKSATLPPASHPAIQQSVQPQTAATVPAASSAAFTQMPHHPGAHAHYAPQHVIAPHWASSPHFAPLIQYYPVQSSHPYAFAPNLVQPAPAPGYPFSHSTGFAGPAGLQPVAPVQPPMYQQTTARSLAQGSAPIDEVRASLREFRNAVHDLTEARARRRYT